MVMKPLKFLLCFLIFFAFLFAIVPVFLVLILALTRTLVFYGILVQFFTMKEVNQKSGTINENWVILWALCIK